MKNSKTGALTKSYIELKEKIAAKISKLVLASEVEDILQETYIRLIKNPQDGTINNLDRFITQIAINLALDHLKKSDTKKLIYVGTKKISINCKEMKESLKTKDSGLQTELMYYCYPSDEDPLSSVIQHQEITNVRRVINTLPNKCKTVFMMKKIYGFSQKEIADELNITESAVEKHIINGMNRCTELLSKYKN